MDRLGTASQTSVSFCTTTSISCCGAPGSWFKPVTAVEAGFPSNSVSPWIGVPELSPTSVVFSLKQSHHGPCLPPWLSSASEIAESLRAW